MHIVSIASTIPPEPFPQIITHVCEIADHDYLPRIGGSGMENCTLVCMYWAQQCRRIAFRRNVLIRSTAQGRRFRDLVASLGSARLSPLVDLILKIDVHHDL